MDIYRLAEKKIGGRLIRLHNTVYQKTNGRIGHRIPACRHPRADVCTYKDAYLIVASISGSFRYPNWYHNLQELERRNQHRCKAIQSCSAEGHPGALR